MTILGHKMSPEGLANLRANAAKARAARRSDPADHPYPSGNAVATTFAEVSAWAEVRGILFRDWEDLHRVNTVRDRRNLLPFKREFPAVKGRFG